MRQPGKKRNKSSTNDIHIDGYNSDSSTFKLKEISEHDRVFVTKVININSKAYLIFNLLKI